jgi:hypothetical protein
MTSQMPRLTAIGLLVLTIATGAAQAAPRNNRAQPSLHVETTNFVSLFRHWFVALFTQRLLPPSSSSTPLQPKEGTILDPNGSH